MLHSGQIRAALERGLNDSSSTVLGAVATLKELFFRFSLKRSDAISL